jgi:hypothetical protein
MRESFARPLLVPATSTTLGVDYLVGGIVGSQGGRLVANHLAASILVDWKEVRMVVPMAFVSMLFFMVQMIASFVRWCFMPMVCASCVVLYLW